MGRILKEPLEIIIPVAPRTKKNSREHVWSKKLGMMVPVPSKAYQKFERDCGWFLKNKGFEYNSPMNIRAYFYQDANREKSDLVGFLQAVDDMLAHYKVIEDDKHTIVVGHDGSRVLVDTKNPRVEILMTPLDMNYQIELHPDHLQEGF